MPEYTPDSEPETQSEISSGFLNKLANIYRNHKKKVIAGGCALLLTGFGTVATLLYTDKVPEEPPKAEAPEDPVRASPGLDLVDRLNNSSSHVKVDQLDGHLVKYDEKGKVNELFGHLVKYDEKGRVNEFDGHLVIYDEKGRVVMAEGHIIKYDDENNIVSRRGSIVARKINDMNE